MAAAAAASGPFLPYRSAVLRNRFTGGERVSARPSGSLCPELKTAPGRRLGRDVLMRGGGGGGRRALSPRPRVLLSRVVSLLSFHSRPPREAARACVRYAWPTTVTAYPVTVSLEINAVPRWDCTTLP